MDSWVKENVLITVMTYPHPSRGYKEVVCTAGITSKGEWVRLYPIDYRHRPKGQQFKKYQWIEVNLKPRAANKDQRKESREPELKSINVIDDPLPTSNNWEARRKIIDELPHHSLNELQAMYSIDKTSLGIVRPSKIHQVKVEVSEGEWKPEWKGLYSQLNLFGQDMLPLRKIPFKFSYIFECEDSHSSHSAMIEDWELGALWLKMYQKYCDERYAADLVCRKYFDELCDNDKDTRFFMGTTYPFNSWVVLGVFWPPSKRQLPLF